MDCDGVFMELTRAPFPSGADSDRDVERHLRACSGCRRIANALRPHDGVRHEELGADQQSKLPVYLPGDEPAGIGAASSGGWSQALPHSTRRRADTRSGPSPSLLLPRGRAGSIGEVSPQVAAFTLASPTATTRLADMISLLGLGLVTLLGAGGVVWFLF